MYERRGPHNSGKCPFHYVPGDVLSAETSIAHCAECVTSDNTQLRSLYEDFCQIGFLTILEEEPKYNPKHPSGASLITFLKSRVCGRFWSERRKQLKYLPFAHDEDPIADLPPEKDLLIYHLIADACTGPLEENEIIRQIEIEEFCEHLPQLLAKLSEQEREVLRLKYFEDYRGVEIARIQSLSEGRVSQLLKSALAKLQKAYLFIMPDAQFEKN